jgi:hypothetical protein
MNELVGDFIVGKFPQVTEDKQIDTLIRNNQGNGLNTLLEGIHDRDFYERVSENDAKFAEIIKWVDVQSQKNGMSFYEMVYIITDKQLIKKRAQQWLSEKMYPLRN